MFWLNPFRTLMNRFPTSRALRRQATRRRRPVQPPCELLEERCLLTTLGDLMLTINNPTPAAFDQFGSSVAAVGNNILVGAFGDNTAAQDSGAAYLFDGTTFDLPSGNSPNDMTLRRKGSTLELLDNNTGLVVQTQVFPTTGGVVIAGSASEDDTLTIDLSGGVIPTVNGVLTVSFDGGPTGTNRLRVVGSRLITGTYTPSPTTAGSGQLATSVAQISFFGCTDLETVGLGNITIVTPNGIDDLTIDSAVGHDGQSANIIAGTSGGTEIASLTFYDSSVVTLDTGRNDSRTSGNDRVTIREDGLIAQGLGAFNVVTGLGNDTLEVLSDSFALPVAGTGLKFDAGAGIDQIKAQSNANLTLINTKLTSSLDGVINFTSIIETAFLAGRDENNLLNSVAFTGRVTLEGGDGEDTLLSGAKDDVLDGGDGDDSLNGGNGVNELIGGDGDDTLISGSAQDFLYGGDGDDSLNGGNGVNELSGGDGDDTLTGGSVRDFLYGGDGDDILIGGAGNDIMDGGDGANRLDGGAGNDYLAAGSYDEEESYSSGSGNNTLLGGAGNDTLLGGDGDDSLNGGTGDDGLYAGDGDNTLMGDTGNDTLNAGDGDDLLNGGNGNNRLFAGFGNDTLIGGSGSDLLNGGRGNDSIVGGAGNDTIEAGTGADTVDAGAGADLVNGGGDEDDEEDGDDSILGGSGNDTIFGGDGNDTIDCGTGYDIFDGESGTNVILNGEEQITY